MALLFAWQSSMGFNLWDEGFLWYGAQRTALGEVPIRDFMAYDPGRYYWSAGFMLAFGDTGIMTLRIAIAAFQILGLLTGLMLIARALPRQTLESHLFLLLAAATLALWMFPRHKLFDISLSIFLIGALSFLVQSPTPRRHFITGLCIGLIAVFGRNHGTYGAIGCIGVMLWLSINRTTAPGFISGLLFWSVGVALGFAPILLLALLVPGFAGAFWESIRFLFELKATNLPLPVPWPWRANFYPALIGQTLREVLIGLFFIGLLVFAGLAILWVSWQRISHRPVQPALAATAFLALPYAQFAYSRADVAHLAQGIFPLLLGCFILIATRTVRIRWPLALALCTASFWVMHVFDPGWQCRIGKHCVAVQVSGSLLQTDPGTARDMALLRQLADRYAPGNEAILVLPYWPGAYALLNRPAPIWETYALFPRPEAFEAKEIARIKHANPSFALILDMPLDGREELRFKHTHPLTQQYVLDNFQALPNPANPSRQIYIAKRLAP